MIEMANERGDDSGIESSNADSGDNSIYIRVNIPELKIQKCLQFHQEDTVWMAKQRVLSILSKELKDSLNFGLYCPPMNGRAGKFLDEERPLKDYPLPGPIGFLEFKYKRRVYKLMQLNPRRLKQLHARSNLKQFMEHVRKYDVDKVNRMTIRGLDPNFHEHETGETPLSVSCQLDKPRNLILALVGGGAHIDFRTRREGFTPLHRAAQRGNYDAIKTFLDLGASPNYKDIHSLTPLYHCVCHDTNPRCVELLLHDHSIIGVSDEHGWTEVHQSCKNGRVQHLEHLLFYGADMNLQNSSGNSPLHVCAVNNQEECARVLLFRGVDKGVLNFANQDAFQVAVIAGNCELADIIKNYKEQDVVPFQELPQYNEKRRMTVTAATLHKLQRSRSDPRLNLIGQSKPSSPAPSNSSMPHFLANGTLFEQSGGGMLYQNVLSRDEYAGSEVSMSVSSGGSFTGSYVSDNGPMMRSVSCDILNTYNNDTSTNSSQGNHEEPVVLNKTTLNSQNQHESKENTPATIRLHKGKNGFGFVLRGAKSQHQAVSTLDFKPTADFPALQYLDRVDRDSMADRAGLKAGDFLLEINGESVVNATHEHTVSLIKNSGDILDMKVVTVKPLDHDQLNQRDIHSDGTRTLPLKKKDRLDRTLAQYENEPDRQSLGNASDSYLMNNMAASRGIDPNNKTASISRRTKRLSSVPLDGIFERQGSRDLNMEYSASNQQKPVVSGVEKIYASPHENGGEAYSHHVTRVQLPDKGRQVDTQSADQYAEINPNVTNVRLSRTVAHDKVYHVNQASDGIYSVPYKHPQEGLSVKIKDNNEVTIPPHPNTAPPEPPIPSRGHNVNIPSPPAHAPPLSPHSTELSQVVPIHTQQHHYANVSDQIQRQRSGTDSDSSHESSFRPGTNAHMSLDPGAAPVNSSSHSRNSSGTSSMSSATSHSDHHLTNGGSGRSSKASLTVAADVHNSPRDGHKFYEPEPDYDKSDSPRRMPAGDIQSLRSVREAWSTRDTSKTSTTTVSTTSSPEKKPTNAAHVIAATSTRTSTSQSKHTVHEVSSREGSKAQAPPTPAAQTSRAPSTPPAPLTTNGQPRTSPSQKEENVMSAFGNAIKLAALARDKRHQDEVSKPKAPPLPPPSGDTALPRQGVPPPPPAGAPPSLVTSSASPVIVKKPLPPHVQKKLDETKKREESHAALMAAVAKRRNIVENIDMDNIADNIETRIQRGKKLQTIVYKSDQSKSEVKIPISSTTPLSLKTKERMKVEDEERTKEEGPVVKNPPQHADDHVNNNTISKINSENAGSPGHVPVTQTNSNTDFLAAAEKARQEYLQKKQQATLERKTGGKTDGAHDSDKLPKDSPQAQSPHSIPSPKPQAQLGNLADIIAQKALQRQKSSEGVLENHNNNNATAGEPSGVRSTEPSSDWSANTVEIHGATMDCSQTETPQSSRTPSFSHMNGNSPLPVSARKKMFEANKGKRSDRVPPLVIPPPQGFSPDKSHVSNKVSVNYDGGHSKVISRHGNISVHNGVDNHSNGLGHVVMDVGTLGSAPVNVDFIPPPPLFDTETRYDGGQTVADDSVSMVSSVSTLSTLSSAEDSVDSPIHSASYSLVPPPPPEFDDSPSASHNNLSSSMEFIPPPVEFDTPVNSPEPVSPLSGTLKNIQKSNQSYSMSYPAARTAPPTSDYRNKPIEAWTVSHVGQWLTSLQLVEHRDRFMQNNMTGQMLIQLDRNKLISLGVAQVGHRMALERAIKKAMMKH